MPDFKFNFVQCKTVHDAADGATRPSLVAGSRPVAVEPPDVKVEGGRDGNPHGGGHEERAGEHPSLTEEEVSRCDEGEPESVDDDQAGQWPTLEENCASGSAG